METVTWRDFHGPYFPHSIFDPLCLTGTQWIVDKVMKEHSLHSVLICDIHTVRFPLDCSQAVVCPYTLFRARCRPHSEGSAIPNIRAGELTLGENVHPPPCVTCNVSHVTFHMSHVRCHVSGVKCHHFFFFFSFLDKVVELVRGGSVIYGAYPV